MTVVAIPAYFSIAYYGRYLKDHPAKWEVVRNALKLMCLVQMSWCLLQFFLYRAADIDLNQEVFVDFLQIIENASFYKSEQVFMPTGLCWHPIIMAPVLILAYYLFNNLFIKIFALLEALFIGNSTVLIAVFLCVVMDIISHIWNAVKKGKMRKVIIVVIVTVLIILIVVLSFTGILQTVFEKFFYVFQRISGRSTDLSTEAHIRYYTAYHNVFHISSISQIFFGYGEGCSGYPYRYMFDQHTVW